MTPYSSNPPRMADDDAPQHSLEWYARETARSSARTAQAARFIAWIIGVGVILSIIFGVIAAVNLAHIASQVSQTATNTTPLG
jgi:hypothetical protein